jgi:MoCo/4Fe-4S cofactor protein with predicted Tat translocation signal
MNTETNTPVDWDAIRQRLAAGDKLSWRGLEELAGSPAFEEMLHREFPDQAAEWTDPVTRRQFITLLGASLALAGFSGCSVQPAPQEKIVPYVRQPEIMLPGKPLSFATSMPLGGLATGLMVTSHEGRPTKVEGNKNHPASLGATDTFAQASVLGLYDPDRSQMITQFGRPRSWNEALAALRKQLNALRDRGGAELRVLTGNVSSPSLAAQLVGDEPGSLLREFPQAKWIQYEPAYSESAMQGARLAFGRPVQTIYHFDKADVVLSLDADFLSCGAGHLRYVHDFMAKRRAWNLQKDTPPAMNRLYVVEAMPSTTGSVADHRLPMKAAEVERFARAVAAELGVEGVKPREALPEKWRKWLAAVVNDLKNPLNKGAAGTSVVVAGDTQPPIVHALAHAINERLKNVGKAVDYIEPPLARPGNQTAEFAQLVRDMADGNVKMLLIFGVNPVFTSPADLEFEKHLQNVALRVHCGLYQDETAIQCQWHIPEAHYLESWGDARAFDGTASIIQPLIAPLYHGRSVCELVAAVIGGTERPGHEIVRDYWRKHWPRQLRDNDFQRHWERSLHDGLIRGTEFAPLTSLTLQHDWTTQPEKTTAGDGLEIVFKPDPTLYDGQFANNGWLQELAKPVSKIAWDNAAFISPATANKPEYGFVQSLGWNAGEHGQIIVDWIELQFDGRTVGAPVWILPGHADDCITVQFGHGRTHAGKVGNGTGFDAYQLRTSTAPWFGNGLRLRKTDKRFTLACTQYHSSMEERQPVRSGTLREYQQNRDFLMDRLNEEHRRFQRELVPGAKNEPPEHVDDKRLVPLTLYPPPPNQTSPNRWGMAIDLTACTGCSACVVACQAENNIPVVGKTEVTRGREMHWLRIDRYYTGSESDPTTYHQPVPCMQCENAPCELVCPVGATAHSADGLNDMVYNRCVGTRYCSNNCPYKVRRFNFLAFADFVTESLKLGRNPNVTVRSRGVMEKCTYCVQRIRSAQITAEIENREVRDGEVVTACQQACPANAILFGDLNDVNKQKTRLAEMKELPLSYGLLAELNTRPRTTYLAALRNPNPELTPEKSV